MSDAKDKPASVAKPEVKDKPPEPKTSVLSKPPDLKSLPPPKSSFLHEALSMARHLDVDVVLFIGDEPANLDELTNRALKKKVVVASSSEKLTMLAEQLGLAREVIPAYAYERTEKIKIALSACISSGKLSNDQRVLCLVGQPNTIEPDTCMLTRIGHDSDETAALGVFLAGSDLSSQVLEAVLHIALSVGFEGIEGTPVGTIFVVGDSVPVMEKSKQLTLNPFQGYSEDERNILDPKIRDAVKNFCLIDGAFIIREDGVLLAAGRYLRSPEDLELDLPLGLGTRNAAAMAVTKATRAVAFVVSKTTGAVRIYKNGKLAIELKQPRRRT